MRGIERIHQPHLRTPQRFANTLPADIGKQAGDQRPGRIIIVRNRPVTGDHGTRASADKGAHQTVEREIPTRRHPGIARRRRRGRAGSIARRQDDRIGIERQVEDLAERQQPVGTAAAERGKQRRACRAFGARRGDKTMCGEMDDAEIPQIAAILERGIGETGTRRHFGAAAADERGSDVQFHLRNRVAPFAERPVTSVARRGVARRDSGGGYGSRGGGGGGNRFRSGVFAKAEIGATAA